MARIKGVPTGQATRATSPAPGRLGRIGAGLRARINWSRRELTAGSKAIHNSLADLRERYQQACLHTFITQRPPCPGSPFRWASPSPRRLSPAAAARTRPRPAHRLG
jgi:hypothetical protein